MEYLVVAFVNDVRVQNLKTAGSPTEVFLEYDDEDLFLKVEGWLTPELAQALVGVLVKQFDIAGCSI